MRTESIECVLSRLKEVFSVSKDIDLARVIGIPKTTLSSWKRRGKVPYLICVQIAEQRGISLDWLLTGKESSDSSSDSESELERLKSQESIIESDGCYESELSDHKQCSVPNRIGTDMTDFLAELARLTPEQQAQALEFIREKRRLNELEARVSALAARR